MSASTPMNNESQRSALRMLAALARCALAVCLTTTAFAHGPLHERIAELSAEVATKPDNAELRYQLAEMCCRHGDWQLALTNLDRVDQLAPGRFPTDLIRGRSALGAGKAEEAKTALDRFIAAHPANQQALILRARAFERLGKNEPCLDDYRAALAAKEHPEPDLFVEAADALVFRGHAEEALRVLDAGMAELGVIPSLSLKALAMEVSLKHYDAAFARLDALQKAAPRPEPWMAKRAALLEQAGRHDESRAAWESLATHLAALPNAERQSHAMSALAEQAQLALRKNSKSSAASLPALQ